MAYEKLKELFHGYDEKYPDEGSIWKEYVKLLEEKWEKSFFRDCMDDGHFVGSIFVLDKTK